MLRVLITVAFLSAFVAPSAAEATFRGANGDLSFIVTTDDGASRPTDPAEWRAVVTTPRGSRVRVLFGCVDGEPDPCELRHDEGPSWSPDGRRVAIGLALGKLAIANADGTNMQVLNSVRGSQPAWSPNGQRLAFIGEGSEIYTVRVDGTAVRQLTSGADARELAWSSRGVLAYTTTETFRGSPAKFGRIITMSATGKHRRELTRGGSPVGLDWSPDGAQLLLLRRAPRTIDLWAMTHRSRRSRLLVRGANSGRWSPDGRSIVFGRGSAFYRARTDGARRREVRLAIPGDWGLVRLQDWQAVPRTR